MPWSKTEPRSAFFRKDRSHRLLINGAVVYGLPQPPEFTFAPSSLRYPGSPGAATPSVCPEEQISPSETR